MEASIRLVGVTAVIVALLVVGYWLYDKDLRGSLLDLVHRNFLRAQVLYNAKVIDTLVQITEVDRQPKFGAMKRDIEMFKSVLSLPIYLIGLGKIELPVSQR